ncbi:beta-1,6-galactofuranosyltransferase [Lactobacillus selangorensis]|uniref:Beta-1,6-galactofuranosyltransferase n=1 Tax=Lactobacillus selangorensis TaxID=81857 RepID=A0A0R2FIB9_9LACO|nr:hypothetical protein [Lactobacillus selangorensis]KRN28355.1 beta-1,6-galactofuranosyltransferase [Lactobacillus selangorensis]KRN31857.1 beta-1,6-galactofuranosyltransferase [Lactobacillus selangorensis]
MTKYVMNVGLEQTNNAMSKAKTDVTYFASHNLDYQPINFPTLKSRRKRILDSKKIIREKLKDFHSNDIFLIQTPTYLGRFFTSMLLKTLQQKQVKTIAFVHDIDDLRFKRREPWKNNQYEVKFYNNFDVVIVSNSNMAKFFRKNGYKGKIAILGIFDYLVEEIEWQFPIKKKVNVINFAGNLKKSEFLWQLNPKYYSLDLFGNISEEQLKKLKLNVKYEGSFNPNEIVNKVRSGYGLVWDGNSRFPTNDDRLLNYERVNDPHKVSLYLTSGIPVLIWEKAALAPFILKNNVGKTISSLDDIYTVISHITDAQFLQMQQNAEILSKKLRTGFYTENAIKNAEKLLEGE